ncbi:DNA sulfur modification protein DndD [Haloglomus halophilum]|uniref:DNA sulfur modification protein DndD n=1 Tax=Haloglomus halophilum TaxID=2962672 RepID=UPI0020C9CB36|nr:DNA sulfur modification protein DndD [Haloglomus halophilum]
MKFNRIVLENYGPYEGRIEFSLRTTEDAPIVLFGGKNGAGKTTLFNAIQVCLHGRSAFDERLSRHEYEDWLRSQLHEADGEQATRGKIQIDFEYADLGKTDNYVVTREIRDRGKSVADELEVKRNGSPLSDLDAEQWDDFLKELIPPGISQLFFFDGEKIQQLATEIKEQDNFADALASLLGLDLIERLDSDLSIYLSQKLEEEGKEELSEKIETLEEELNEIDEQQAALEEQIKSKEARIDELGEQIDKKEQELTQEGGDYAAKRDEYKERRTRLETQRENLEDQIRDLATDCYPFALAPDLCREVVEQLESERVLEEELAAKKRAGDILEDVATDEAVLSETDIDPESASEIVKQIQTALDDRLEDSDEDTYRLSEEFSRREQQEMETVVNRALNEVPQEMGDLTRELEEKTKEQQETETKLQRAPEQSVIQPVLADIQRLSEERSRLEQEIEQHRQELENLEERRSKKEVSLENRLEDKEELESVSDRAALASDVRSAVKDYRQELIEQKLTQLEDALTERYLQLSNKAGFYEQVLIDTDEVSITIETKNGTRKDQSQLSAGERQIFATAMLWALADISGRPLPFMIDTPLARLDQDHRGNLVESFFPNAAHQVLIFSTDTEITEERYNELRDRIAAEYHLEADEETGQTDVSPGYFWTAPSNAIQGPGMTSSESSVQYDKQAHLQGYENE